jgi:Transcriptional regulator, AbiEi antitoxin
VLGGSRFLVVAGTPDHRLTQLARAQRGCVSRRQLLAAGLSPAQIRTRIGRGQLATVHLGVYLVAGAVGVPLHRQVAALRDRRKDRALQKLGIEYRRVTWDQMQADPLELIADIATTIERRTRAAG